MTAIPLARSSFVRTRDGVELFVRDRGRGTPLVFLSGWTLNSDAWACQTMPLSRRGFRCVAYDRRAHGRSGDPGRGFDFDTLADDLADVLEALEDDFPSWIEANAAPCFGPAGTRPVIDWTARTMTQASLLATVELARIQLETDFRPELARIGKPVVVIHGDADAS
jgi:pimeloyl-ACP methyl ester carboxylesterase